jgi:hypothetical protein
MLKDTILTKNEEVLFLKEEIKYLQKKIDKLLEAIPMRNE